MTEVQSEIKKNRLQIEKFILQALKMHFRLKHKSKQASSFVACIKLIVFAFLLHQFSGRSAFDDLAVVHHNDLVRFGKYLEAWWAKPADTHPGHILLPIPEEKRGANPNLEQNPGY